METADVHYVERAVLRPDHRVRAVRRGQAGVAVAPRREDEPLGPRIVCVAEVGTRVGRGLLARASRSPIPTAIRRSDAQCASPSNGALRGDASTDEAEALGSGAEDADDDATGAGAGAGGSVSGRAALHATRHQAAMRARRRTIAAQPKARGRVPSTSVKP